MSQYIKNWNESIIFISKIIILFTIEISVFSSIREHCKKRIQKNRILIFLIIMAIIPGFSPIVASAAPPSVSSISSATYTENDQMTIDPAISVTGDEAVSDAKVSIGTGYVSGEDSLTYTTTNGVTGSFDTGTGILSLTGGSLPSDYQAAFRNVKYFNNNDNPNTNQRVITFAIGNSLYYPGTGHYYEYVEASITWDDARTAADARRLYGLQGYLATITSAGENDFIQSKVAGDAWIGASDSSVEGAWRWMTGPEGTEEIGQGRQFWQGIGGSGSVIGGYYNKWASGEPNDYNSGSPGEDYAYMISNQGGTWNDYPTSSSLSYFTEYGGRAGDPVLNLTATVTVSVTAVNDAPTTPGAFTSPTTGQTKTGNQPITVIWGSSTDPDSAVKYDLWYFNNTWKKIGNLLPGTSMTYNLPADTTNSAMFRVYANDTVLNSSARDVTFTVDATAPTFTIQYYSDSGLTAPLGDNPKLKAGTYYIKITSSETLSGIPTISIDAEGTANDETVESTVAVSGNDYRYTRTIATDAAAVGSVPEDISITGTDVASNTATNVNPTDEASKAAYTDTIAPSITIISPVNMTYSNTSFVLNVTTNQPTNVTYSLNGDTNQSLYNMTTNGNTTITGMEGANNITVNANDSAGNLNSSIVYFAVDTTAPSLSITQVISPTNITYQNITGTVSDSGGVETVTVNGIAATNGTGYYYYNLTGLELGNNTITVIATDLAGNAAISTTYILVIPEVPAITSYAPPSSVSDSTGATRTFNISIDQVVNVTWYLNETYLYTNTSVSEANYTNSSAGSGTWNVTAIVNNTNGTDSREWTWIVMADIIPPVITISVPVNNANLSIFDRIISGSITDDSAITANMYVNSVFTNTWASKGSFRWPYNITNGANTINISATDAYSNINWTNISVFVLSPVNDASVNLTVNQSVNITANDSTGVDVVLATGNNTANVTVKINASINASYFNASDIDTEFVALDIARKSLVKFVEINATGDVVNLSSVKITMFYNDSDLDLNGNGIIDAGDIKEDTLNLYWHWNNDTSGNQEWFPLTLGADYSGKLDRNNNSGPIVSSVERNTAFKYISVSTNHFSLYSIAGASIPATTTTTTGSGGGGSGGGGVVTGEPSENIARFEMIEKNLEAGKPVTYTFTKNQEVVYEVLVTGKENEYDVSIRIEILKNRSKQAKENVPGLVYRNANIISGTKNIGENVIKFKVNDSWLLENGFDISDIRLVKWVDNKWIILETGVLFNKDGYTHFSAKSMTFSTYAITGIKKGESMSAPLATEKTVVTPEAAPLSTEEPTPQPEGKTPVWVWMILALLLIAALVYAFKRR